MLFATLPTRPANASAIFAERRRLAVVRPGSPAPDGGCLAVPTDLISNGLGHLAAKPIVAINLQ
jgi:hypothetical protein